MKESKQKAPPSQKNITQLPRSLFEVVEEKEGGETTHFLNRIKTWRQAAPDLVAPL